MLMENLETDIVVIGGGPGGYTAALYAAAKGKTVVLVEKDSRLGGVCLNRGCIPSKALLHAAGTIDAAGEAEKFGIGFSGFSVDLSVLQDWKSGILEKLAQGISNLTARRGVKVVRAEASFENATAFRAGGRRISFKNAIIATGSLPAIPQPFKIGNPRVMTSTEALDLRDIPGKLLVIGGGYIGMELGAVYASLGSEVTVVEALEGLLNGADQDLVRYVDESARKRFKNVYLASRVLNLAEEGGLIKAAIETGGKVFEEKFDRVLVSVGRVSSTQGLNLESAGIKVDEKGFIVTDDSKQTASPSVYAVGDVTGGVMLAHKASREARIAVDAILGESVPVKTPVIPAVVFTDPEVAWCGLTETEARIRNVHVQVVRFPWSASGRAAAVGRTEGVTKLIIDPATEKIIGAGICGKGAGELISAAVMAVELGMTAGELGDMVYPHPTLSETLTECAEMFYGRAIHAFSRKRV